MRERERRRIRGNMIAARLEQLLEQDGWGATERLAARLQLLAELPQFEGLREIRPNSITGLLTRGSTCPDILLVAIAQVYGVDPAWLLGLVDDPHPRRDLRWPAPSEDHESPSTEPSEEE